MEEPNRERLGRLVTERRGQLGLSISAAARAAGVDRATWTGIERATRRTEEYNYAGVERTLAWAAGSIEQIMTGGRPVEVEQQSRAPLTIDLLDEYERIRGLSVSCDTKLNLVGEVIKMYLTRPAPERETRPA